MAIKILIVDDEVLFKKVVSQFFKQQIKEGKYEFHYATNGKEAIKQITSGLKIDIVLVDIRMPEMDGLTMMEKFNDQGIEVKTIIVSAYPDLPNVKKAMNEGAFDFLVKPLNLEELEECINRLFRLKKQSTKLAKPAETKQAGKIKSLLSDPSSQKVTQSLAYNIVKRLRIPQQMIVIERLVEKFNVEEIDELKYKIEAQEYVALEKQKRREEIAQEAYQRLGLDPEKVPLIALEQGFIEERFVQKKLATGGVKGYGVYLYLRWTDEGTKGYYLGPANNLDEAAKEILSIIGYSLDKSGLTQNSTPEDEEVEPVLEERPELKPKLKQPIRMYGKDFDAKSDRS